MNKSGTLIVIDGIDGSGKNTQAKLLYEGLEEMYYDKFPAGIEMVSFPRYKTAGCTMVEKYLGGEFGKDPSKVDPYTASMFYMIDRSISFQNDRWGEVYRRGGLVVADRYYTSNIIHQSAKIIAEHNAEHDDDWFSSVIVDNKLNDFTDWLINTETENMHLPSPNKVIWLMLNKESNNQLIKTRSKTDRKHKSDIHENNTEYLDNCREALSWYKTRVESMRDTTNVSVLGNYYYRDEFINANDESGNIKTIEKLHLEIWDKVIEILK